MQDRIENGEQRWQTVGAVQGFVILVVAHLVTEEDAEGGSVEIIPHHCLTLLFGLPGALD